MTDEQIARRLADELGRARPITMQIPAFEGFTLLAVLQLAWRHPGLTPLQRGFIEKAGRDLQDAIAERSAFAAETLERGWDRNQDTPPAPPLDDERFSRVVKRVASGTASLAEVLAASTEVSRGLEAALQDPEMEKKHGRALAGAALLTSALVMARAVGPVGMHALGLALGQRGGPST